MDTNEAETARSNDLIRTGIQPGRYRQWLFSGSGYDTLPTSVKESIARQQDRSEILIGWIQFAILCAFATLYAVAPKAFPAGSEFQPVPYFLGAYFLFTCVRILLAYRRRLPYAFLFVSIVVDMALLYGLIWTFHVQYMQPPAFYLKAPTLLYVFIFISLRALRFEPGFVLFAGVTAATGWLVMVSYAVYANGGMEAVTRNYVEYLTSNLVLWGAEFDKVISIFVVTIVLTLVISRGRELLIRSLYESSAAERLSRFVPHDVAARIASSDGPLIAQKSESREATIMFIDLEAFTSIGEELSPDQLIVTLNEYFAVVSEPIEKFHGVINQFQGDAVLASFNLPKRDEHHARNAVRAALEIQQRLADHRFSADIALKARIGINTGQVVGGFVGTPDRLSYTVHGDDVNIAARLEQLNKEYGTRILLSDRTRVLTGSLPGCELLLKGEAPLRGRQRPLKIYEPVTGKPAPAG